MYRCASLPGRLAEVPGEGGKHTDVVKTLPTGRNPLDTADLVIGPKPSRRLRVDPALARVDPVHRLWRCTAEAAAGMGVTVQSGSRCF